MMISARQASELLVRPGVSRRGARAVLEAGLAGEGERTSSAVLYDEARVRELAERPTLTWPQAWEVCGRGLFVSRRPLPRNATATQQRRALEPGWRGVSLWDWLAIGQHIKEQGPFPFVATVGGLVVVGAEIVAVSGADLALQPPGAWFDGLERCWFPTDRGRSWALSVTPWNPAKIAG